MYQNNHKQEACDVLKTAMEKGSVIAEELIEKLCK
jgi:hypothetical protein